MLINIRHIDGPVKLDKTMLIIVLCSFLFVISLVVACCLVFGV